MGDPWARRSTFLHTTPPQLGSASTLSPVSSCNAQPGIMQQARSDMPSHSFRALVHGWPGKVYPGRHPPHNHSTTGGNAVAKTSSSPSSGVHESCKILKNEQKHLCSQMAPVLFIAGLPTQFSPGPSSKMASWHSLGQAQGMPVLRNKLCDRLIQGTGVHCNLLLKSLLLEWCNLQGFQELP